MKHRYLFSLEITTIEVGKTYDELPSHLTLMSRFFSELSPAELIEVVQPLFKQTEPIELTFGETAKLGPKKLGVHLIEHSMALRQLHNKLRKLLDSIGVDYEYPQFIGDMYQPHVTKRENTRFEVGYKLRVNVSYLIEIIDGQRVISSKLKLR